MSVQQSLERPFPVSRLHWRIGATNQEKTSGIALAYIDARDVMRRLDESVGFEKWQCRYSHADKLIICEIGLLIAVGSSADGWSWRANGAGETAVEGQKGGCSDAFKRAAVMWGIGRYLYALPNVWVPIENRRLPDSSIELLINRLPAWATPEGYDEIQEKRKAA